MPEYTVSDISRQLKRTVEDAYGHVRVRGEIGSCKLHSSGHMYLTLKDEGAVLDGVCWRGQVSKLAIRPEMGMEVVCTGKLTTYPGSSKYQIVIEAMALAGQGALLKMLEDRRKKLAAEGLFDAARKRPLPFLPEVIGVVTSPTGAVIRDILHRLADRFPRPVLVWPVPVQGEGAAAKIAAAIRGFNALEIGGAVPRPDLLIVARGGGSLEDLMPFNEEDVVRAVADSRIPIISAVGHETDTTLIDYAADLRAPTPTGAAEKAVPVRDNLLAMVEELESRRENAIRRALRERRERIELLGRALGDPARALQPLMQKLDERADRLGVAWQGYVRRLQSRVAEAGGRLRHPRDIVRLAAQQLHERGDRLGVAWQGYTRHLQSLVAEAGGRLRHPRNVVRLAAQRLQTLSGQLTSLGRERLLQTEKRLEKAVAMLEALSPRAVMGRGYALVYGEKGLITRAAEMKAGDQVRIEHQDGSRKAQVEE